MVALSTISVWRHVPPTRHRGRMIDATAAERWMREALAEARAALDHDDVPVGAVVVAPDGTELARAPNRPRRAGGPARRRRHPRHLAPRRLHPGRHPRTLPHVRRRPRPVPHRPPRLRRRRPQGRRRDLPVRPRPRPSPPPPHRGPPRRPRRRLRHPPALLLHPPPLYSPTARCQSGRMGRSRKPLTSRGVHGFESHPCRHLPAQTPSRLDAATAAAGTRATLVQPALIGRLR